jgi:tetratricopeptide (TPR) repeat protein
MSGTEPDVFLSSPLQGFAEVRAEITALAPSRFWTVPADFDVEHGTPAFAIVERMADQIRNSNLFICVLTGRYGTSVYEDAASVSILETEIYHAALFHRNVHFYRMEPFEVDERIGGLLEILRTVRPDALDDRPRPKREIIDQIGRVLESSRPRKRSRALSIRRLVSELAVRRGDGGHDIEFFDGVFRRISDKPNKDRIENELASLAGETRMEYQLTRMWIALRELSAAPYDDSKYAEYLPLWNAALGAWSSAAAWLGLHGHLYAGRLAAVNSLLRIRESMEPRQVQEDLARYIQGTKGARGSEYYSMARLMRTKAERDRYLGLAASEVEQAMRAQSAGDDISGYLAILGHIHVGQRRLHEAASDFAAMRELREKRGDLGGIGEAKKDQALILMRQRRFSRARELLNEAVEQLSAEPPKYGFLVQALKARAVTEAATGDIFAARATLLTAYDIATQQQIYDQITVLMELIHDPRSLLEIWRR